MAQEIWVSTDETEDVACSIRHVLRCMDFVESDPEAWKWVILALHAALQGACVCHLSTTCSPIGAVTKRNTREWAYYLEKSRVNPDAKSPKTQLMSLPDLLKTVRKPNTQGDLSNNIGIQISDAELTWLNRLHEDYRNQFSHFSPTGWTYDVSGLPEIAKLVARIITDIHLRGWAFRHLEDQKKATLVADLDRLSNLKACTPAQRV
ncbi:MAG: hypothetical protein OIF56_11820 [Cohaesibacter sp.]|nr:hypothetical protein [Cohaesibacter sp.]